jgi:hypothetical protein
VVQRTKNASSGLDLPKQKSHKSIREAKNIETKEKMIIDEAPAPPKDPSPKFNESIMDSDDAEVEFSEEPSKPEMYRSYVTDHSQQFNVLETSPNLVNRHRMANTCYKSRESFNRVVNDEEFTEIVDRAK